jgi:hypothetical protein
LAIAIWLANGRYSKREPGHKMRGQGLDLSACGGFWRAVSTEVTRIVSFQWRATSAVLLLS